MCFTLRHIKEGICFIVRHISFLASWWVGTRFSAIDIGLYSRGELNMCLQNVRGSIITARSLIIRHLSLLSGVLGGVEGRRSLVRMTPLISACYLPRWNRIMLRESLAW